MDDVIVSERSAAMFVVHHMWTSYRGESAFLLTIGIATPFILFWTHRTTTRKLSAASTLLLLSMPMLSAIHCALSGFGSDWRRTTGHAMKLAEIADNGTFFCIFLLLGVLLTLPAYLAALALYIRRSFHHPESAR